VTQKEVEPLHISYTIEVRGDVVFRFLAIGLNHFPTVWGGGPHFPQNLIFASLTGFCGVGGFRRDNVNIICLLGHDRIGKSKGINSAHHLLAW
jgi:hypothetical protein